MSEMTQLDYLAATVEALTKELAAKDQRIKELEAALAACNCWKSLKVGGREERPVE